MATEPLEITLCFVCRTNADAYSKPFIQMVAGPFRSEDEAREERDRLRSCDTSNAYRCLRQTHFLANHERPEDTLAGVAVCWWNRLTEIERARWLHLAASARPVDAFCAWIRRADQRSSH